MGATLRFDLTDKVKLNDKVYVRFLGEVVVRPMLPVALQPTNGKRRPRTRHKGPRRDKEFLEWTEGDDENLIWLYQRGESYDAIAKALGRTKRGLTNRLGKLRARGRIHSRTGIGTAPKVPVGVATPYPGLGK